ncbi:MAG: RmlC-like protein [Paenibacillaceae bacterium]|jgi:mannose-6-phosphate isomerase|nr:RmlC-like protein [Paenibacillaceae bacterium]
MGNNPELMGARAMPLKLMGNRVWRTYLGGHLLSRWLGGEAAGEADGHYPEEWVGSLTQARNPDRTAAVSAKEAKGADRPEGLSLVDLGDGRNVLLKELVDSYPAEMLGARHVQRYGAQPGMLVKVLDSAERLAIQVHPDREAAREIFQSSYGKTEAWYILGGRSIGGEKPYVLAGFKPGVTRSLWEELFRKQDIPAMTEALHRFEVEPGQVVLIQGGLPHAIGPGCLLVELQEPTDYTIRVERTTPAGLQLSDFSCHQGAGFARMFDCFHYEDRSREETALRCFLQPSAVEQHPGGTRRELIGKEHTPYFGMEEWSVCGGMNMSMNGPDSFSILLAVEGSGELGWEGGAAAIRQGEAYFLPAYLEGITCSGYAEGLRLIRCLPPKA